MTGLPASRFYQILSNYQNANIPLPFPKSMEIKELQNLGRVSFLQKFGKLAHMLALAASKELKIVEGLDAPALCYKHPLLVALLTELRRWTVRGYDLFKYPERYFDRISQNNVSDRYERILLLHTVNQCSGSAAQVEAMLDELNLPPGDRYQFRQHILIFNETGDPHLMHTGLSAALSYSRMLYHWATHLYEWQERKLVARPHREPVSIKEIILHALALRFPVTALYYENIPPVAAQFTPEEDTMMENFMTINDGHVPYSVRMVWIIQHVLRYQGKDEFPQTMVVSFLGNEYPITGFLSLDNIFFYLSDPFYDRFNDPASWPTVEFAHQKSFAFWLLFYRWAIRYKGFTARHDHQTVLTTSRHAPVHAEGNDVRIMAQLALFTPAQRRAYLSVLNLSPELVAWAGDDESVMQFMNSFYPSWLAGFGIDMVAAKAILVLIGFEKVRQQEVTLMDAIHIVLRANRMRPRTTNISPRLARFLRIFARLSPESASGIVSVLTNEKSGRSLNPAFTRAFFTDNIITYLQSQEAVTHVSLARIDPL